MIALDAMGGDFAPHVTVIGALNAAKKGIPITLFGDEFRIRTILDQSETQWRSLPLFIEHCSEEVAMGDEPSRSIIQKQDSSLVRAVCAVAQKKAKAVVSAGNSGAALVAATLIIGRVNGILRPAIGGFIPKKNGSLFCIDLGANTDCKPEYLEQFALMGHLYVQLFHHKQNPKIALLSNGAEPYKGSMAVKEAYKRLESSTLNFLGNLESRDIFDSSADVLVCDGFVGNVLLKGIQGTAKAISYWLKQEAQESWWWKLYFALGSRVFSRLKNKMDYAKHGGALLLGVREPVIIAHGSSCERAIEHALVFAHETVRKNVITSFNERLMEQLNAISIKQGFQASGLRH